MNREKEQEKNIEAYLTDLPNFKEGLFVLYGGGKLLGSSTDSADLFRLAKSGLYLLKEVGSLDTFWLDEPIRN